MRQKFPGLPAAASLPKKERRGKRKKRGRKEKKEKEIAFAELWWWCRPAKYSFSLSKIDSAALALVNKYQSIT